MPKKSLRYRLALDLGSTSLGWAMFVLKETGEVDYKLMPVGIIKAGVRIFSDGRNPKDGSSLAVTRRAARAMRRRRDRLLKRKARMMDALVQHGFFPADAGERKKLELLNPYELRAKGLNEALTPGEFARALFHINQRRGFKSNRKTDKADNDSGALKQAISQLRQAITDSGCATVGQWLWQERLQKDQGTRARYRETPTTTDDGKKRILKSYDLYIDRAMVEQEFDALWAKQAALNPTVFNETARHTLKDVLLHQRPLRPVKPGRCTLIPTEERAPLALPSTQRFRIYQEVNHLRLLDAGLTEKGLTLAQRDAVVALLEKSAKVTFKAIKKKLGLGDVVQFSVEDAKRQELKGNVTSAILSRKDLFGDAWHGFAQRQQDDIVWELLTQESEGQLIDWLVAHTGVDAGRAEAIANVKLPDGYGSLSRAALAQIVPELQRDVITYDKAVQAAGFAHHSDLSGFDFEHSEDEVELIGERIIESTGEIKPVFAFKELPYYGRALQRHVAFAKDNPRNDEERYGKIANPTVHIGLNQTRVVVNALIKKYGRPTEVVIELARDLKQSREQKLETQRKQAENQKRNERIRQAISDTYRAHGRSLAPENVKRLDIQKWILWEELSFDVADRRCPYSGVQISAQMLLSEAVEIEHILPYSQTLDDSLNNRTVSMREANRVKGNRTPWAAREDFEREGWSYDGILLRAERMPKAKRYRFAPDGYERWNKDDKGFLARALNDTRHLSRVAKAYLNLVCPGSGVRVIPGGMTALLRAKFGLNDVLGVDGEKNRDDHRHHAVDACVIGITDQGMLQQLSNASKLTREKNSPRLVENMPLPWATYRAHVERAVSHIWVSHRPDHGFEGAMMEETSYGIRRNGEIKQKRKADGSTGREISNLIRINEPSQPERHGVDAEGKPLPYKGYVGGSNYCIEITRNEKCKWEGEVISTFRAYEIVREGGYAQLRDKKLGQNGRELVMRLVIDDVVLMDLGGKTKAMRFVKVTASNGQMTFAEANEANVDARNASKEDPFSYTTKYAGSLQRTNARRVTISPIGELRDPGFKG